MVYTVLSAFAADRRAAADTDRKAAAPAADVCPRGPQQQTRRTLLQRSIYVTDRRTDGRKTVSWTLLCIT